MRNASNEYKQMMNKMIRNRAYASIGIGIINQNAQKDGVVTSPVVDWCNKQSIFDSHKTEDSKYATLEENFMKTDGTMVFLPERNRQKFAQSAVSKNTMGSIKISFGLKQTIKGLTLEFGEHYPLRFKILTSNLEYYYDNSGSKFSTSDIFSDTEFLEIVPVEIMGGQKRLRIYNVVMGIGLSFSNAEIKDLTISDYVSSISEELPRETMNLSVYDVDNNFNVDDNNSFIQFLQSMQKVTLSFGVDLDSGSKEWIDYATLYLSDWDSFQGILSITAEDRISSMEDEYSAGNKIYTRTAYQEAENILKDAGLTSDEYQLDEYLKDVVLTNPMPVYSHRECLQLLSNACRCKLYQDHLGRIVIKANFASTMNADEINVSAIGAAAWSKPRNVLYGTDYVYADMTNNTFKTDGTLYFMPEGQNYLNTAYVSDAVGDFGGFLNSEASITLQLPSAYSYNGINVKFGGNPPPYVQVDTYKNNVMQDSVIFDELEEVSLLQHSFKEFDKVVFRFQKAHSFSRIIVNQISFGDLSDYVLTKDLMLEKPHGFVEKKIKSVKVKVFTFVNGEDGAPEEVEDNVYCENILHGTGTHKICENPLVSTMEHAELLATWLGNYYSSNISYDVRYRGEPRIASADVIKMESDYIDDLEVEVEDQTLSFNGAFSGTLGLRRALRKVV